MELVIAVVSTKKTDPSMYVSIVVSVAAHILRNYMGHDVRFSIKTEFKICNFLRTSLFKNISGVGM